MSDWAINANQVFEFRLPKERGHSCQKKLSKKFVTGNTGTRTTNTTEDVTSYK